MYTVKMKTDFSGAHNLRGYKGKCEELHGHNWKVEAEIRADKLDDTGMVLDFTVLKQSLKDIMSDLDHKYLNEVGYFRSANPTSENIARYIYEKLSEKYNENDIVKITVWETDSASATYSKNRM